MLSSFNNMRLKSVGNLTCAMVVAVAVTIGISSHVSISGIGKTGTAWSEFESGAARKADVLNDLRDAIGYGGVIH